METADVLFALLDCNVVQQCVLNNKMNLPHYHTRKLDDPFFLYKDQMGF